MYSRLRQSRRPDADANGPAAATGDDGYEIPVPSDVSPLPLRVHAYENIAEQSGMGKNYSFVGL